MELGQRIRNERKMMNMTLEKLAKKVGISKMTLHRIETGKTSPSIARSLRKQVLTICGSTSTACRKVNGPAKRIGLRCHSR